LASFYVCRRASKECRDCGFCTEHFVCPGVGKPSIERFETACVDCRICLMACPYKAVQRVRDTIPRKQVKISIDGTEFAVPERITIKRALELLGLEFSRFPKTSSIFAPCETGGCFTCATTIDGGVKPSCVTLVKEGMSISLEQPEGYIPHACLTLLAV